MEPTLTRTASKARMAARTGGEAYIGESEGADRLSSLSCGVRGVQWRYLRGSIEGRTVVVAKRCVLRTADRMVVVAPHSRSERRVL
jgi:hypothetical protein